MYPAESIIRGTGRAATYGGNRFVPLERRQIFGLLCLFGLLCTTLIDINALVKRLFDISQAASLVMLAFAIGSIIAFRFRFVRAIGAPGIAYLAMVGYHLVVCTLMRFGDPSMETMIVTRYYFRLYATSPIILLAVALGVRHLCATLPLQRAVGLLFLVSLVQVAAIFVDAAFGDQLFGSSFIDPESDRAAGFFENPNAAGFSAAATAALGFGCLVFGKRSSLPFLLACLAACGVACILTFSRSSILGLFCVGLVQPVVSPIFKQKSLAIFSMLFLGAVAWFVLVGVHYFLDLDRDQAMRLESFRTMASGEADASTTGYRFVVASKGIQFWLESPIFGHGLGTGSGTDPEFQQRGYGQHGPHNQFVFCLMEGGLPLLLLFVLFQLVFLRRSWRCEVPAIRVATFGYLIVFAAQSLTDHGMFTHNSHAAMMGASMGMLSAADYISRLKKRPLAATPMLRSHST